MTAAEPAVRRRAFGKQSVQIAFGIFVAATALLVAFYQIPETASWHDVAAGAVVIAVGIMAPLGHLAGLVLGLIAIFRAGDRHLLGIIGVLLNVVVVAIGAFLVYMAASGLAPR